MSLYLSSLPQLSATSSIILWHTVFGSLILVPTAMKSEIDKLLILYMAKKKRQGHANMIFSLSLMPFYTWTRPAVNGVIYLMTFRHGRPYITIQTPEPSVAVVDFIALTITAPGGSFATSSSASPQYFNEIRLIR